MKKINRIFLPLLLFFALGITAIISLKENTSLSKQDFTGLTKEQVLLKIIMSSLETIHYNSIPIDNDFSKKVFSMYMGELDGGKRLFTQEDISHFKPYENLLDDMISDSNYEFFHETSDVFNERVEHLEEVVNDILSHPFVFKKSDFFTIKKIEDTQRPKDDKALKELWTKILRHNILQEIYDENKQQKEYVKEGKKDKLLTAQEIEEKAREKIKTNQAESFRNLKSLDEQDWTSFYLNSITLVYDPHTVYFPPRDKETFDISMSGRLQGIGATLTEKDGYVMVANIMVGSPCWKQGDLSVDDKILLVSEGDSGETTNLVGMRVEQAVTYIRGKKGTEVRLTVEHVDGTREMIPIIRDIIEMAETYAKKAIVDDIGYIFLPKFYADFNRTGGPSCAEDVKKAIIELQKNNVKGIVLDLRNNGGGSLSEVVDMAGLFIEKGPIVQVQSKRSNKKVLRDPDSRISYDGPLVVMVNGFSASASEILAAAMQDYNRAIILGTNKSTYGKGTVQRALDLDDQFGGFNDQLDEFKPLGALKLTLQKFYRIDGSSTQLKGVEPDIVLPSLRSYIISGEKEQKNAIPWDTIETAKYKKWGELNKKEVIEKSRRRVKNNPYFKKADEQGKWLKKTQEEVNNVPLTLPAYTKWKKEREKIADGFQDFYKKVEKSPVSLTSEDKLKYESDTIYATKVDKWFKTLSQDIYLKEAINVVKDVKH